MAVWDGGAQAGRAGMPPWRLARTFGGASDDGASPTTGDDNLTARAGAMLQGPLRSSQTVSEEQGTNPAMLLELQFVTRYCGDVRLYLFALLSDAVRFLSCSIQDCSCCWRLLGEEHMPVIKSWNRRRRKSSSPTFERGHASSPAAVLQSEADVQAHTASRRQSFSQIIN